jgi:hypothetical protein
VLCGWIGSGGSGGGGSLRVCAAAVTGAAGTGGRGGCGFRPGQDTGLARAAAEASTMFDAAPPVVGPRAGSPRRSSSVSRPVARGLAGGGGRSKAPSSARLGKPPVRRRGVEPGAAGPSDAGAGAVPAGEGLRESSIEGK